MGFLLWRLLLSLTIIDQSFAAPAAPEPWTFNVSLPCAIGSIGSGADNAPLPSPSKFRKQISALIFAGNTTRPAYLPLEELTLPPGLAHEFADAYQSPIDSSRP